ncbi:MAG: right-handed parallel beta-helix repeat-containing protein [Akkermansiaceae bacterium]
MILLLASFSVLWVWNSQRQEKATQQRVATEEKKRNLLLEKDQLEKKLAAIESKLKGAREALNDSRFGDAEIIIHEVLDLDPASEAAEHLLRLAQEMKLEAELTANKKLLLKALDSRKIAEAQKYLDEIKRLSPDHKILRELSEMVGLIQAEIAQEQQMANELYQQALILDNGSYSQKAIELLEKAKMLYPGSVEITQLFQKMSQYSNVLKVPRDYASINDAIAAARLGDLIQISAGVYDEAIVVNKKIRLRGSIGGKTIIKIPSFSASAITITRSAEGSTISGFKILHTGFDYSEERFAGITVQAKNVLINSCTVTRGGGHGIAVLDGAEVIIQFCKVLESGWDGISIYGENSVATIKESLCQRNMRNGIEFWDGGSGSVSKCIALENNLNGIAVSSPQTETMLNLNVCSANRGTGILISQSSTVDAQQNLCENNILSGIVAKDNGTTVALSNNIARKNQEAGIAIYKEVEIKTFYQNKAKANGLYQQIRPAHRAIPVKD